MSQPYAQLPAGDYRPGAVTPPPMYYQQQPPPQQQYYAQPMPMAYQQPPPPQQMMAPYGLAPVYQYMQPMPPAGAPYQPYSPPYVQPMQTAAPPNEPRNWLILILIFEYIDFFIAWGFAIDLLRRAQSYNGSSTECCPHSVIKAHPHAPQYVYAIIAWMVVLSATFLYVIRALLFLKDGEGSDAPFLNVIVAFRTPGWAVRAFRLKVLRRGVFIRTILDCPITVLGVLYLLNVQVCASAVICVCSAFLSCCGLLSTCQSPSVEESSLLLPPNANGQVMNRRHEFRSLCFALCLGSAAALTLYIHILFVLYAFGAVIILWFLWAWCQSIQDVVNSEEQSQALQPQ